MGANSVPLRPSSIPPSVSFRFSPPIRSRPVETRAPLERVERARFTGERRKSVCAICA